MKFANCTPYSNSFILPFACQDNIPAGFRRKSKADASPRRARKQGLFVNRGGGCLRGRPAENGCRKGGCVLISPFFPTLQIDPWICIPYGSQPFDCRCCYHLPPTKQG
jgi:hypothetical protein